MRQMLCRLVLCAFFAALSCLTANAQEKKWVSGSVKDSTGNPVASATIAEKGTSNQTASNGQGAFRIQVASGATLVISAVGFGTQEVSATDGVNVTLQNAAAGLDEVVVTALGIRRQKKSLGYAVQEVKGRTVADVREPNITNSLSGLVAGLQVIRSSNGPAGSSKIVLRGMNSLTGSNQPLIVVDGIPIDNFTGVENNDFFNPQMDMGNGLADINAEDIESISVLKGAASAALYGSRAGNGAILITTKSGRKVNGLGITVGSTLGFEKILMLPERQSSFAQGNNGVYANDKNNAFNWGPKIEGQEVTNWNGQKENLRAYDNVDAFYGTGVNHNQSVSLQQQYKNTSVYTSMNYLNDKSVIPGAKLTRVNLMTRATSKFGKDDRWSTDFKVQYSNSKAVNRPQAGSNANNYSALLLGMPITVDVTQFKNAVKPDRTMYWWNDLSSQVNPYWNAKYRTNMDDRDRFILNGSIKYQFTEWLDAEIKAGGDMYNTDLDNKLYAGSPLGRTGRYSNGKISFKEFNYSTLITAKKDNLFGKLGGTAALGGNLMDQQWSQLELNVGELQVPDLFLGTNGKDPVSITDKVRDKKINSVYGTVGLNWDGYLYLEGTFRNDWSSALAKNYRSYFYPSISLSYIFTEHLKGLPSWLSYGKIRGSISEVGNDMPPYNLYNTYVIERDANGRTVAKRDNTKFDSTVTNELIRSLELGAELRFLNNRVGLDFSYYRTTASNQLINLPMDPGSGYDFKRINAGRIRNEGFEIAADAKILTNPNGLSWNVNVNFSTNKNTVLEIYPKDDVQIYNLQAFDDAAVVAEAGKLFGEIYGSQFVRVTDKGSADYGKLLLTAQGLPQRSPTIVRLGNQQPKALLGITNTFAYKNWHLGFLVDGRFGGQIFSGTNADLQQSGVAAVTAPGGNRADFVVDGVVAKSGGGYETNTTAVTPQRYWNAVAGVSNLGITEANIYDATNIRLRNVQLSYEFPKKMLGRTPIQRAKLGVSCNNVWLITSHLNGVDPESVFATGGSAVGFEYYAPPTTRSFLINLMLSF
ncbi:MAG: SusC/RagA family TonB-linked outer membrane protein [Pseudobacter sp.]|uniref:SusC/RagA family TonB-linked outer membrane protein n=1 Tax=Pseudobacter sp. TaxID=2045420 RepID=UPI003F80BD30